MSGDKRDNETLELEKRLTTDAELDQLMAADYEAKGKPVDEVAAQRVYARLKKSVAPSVSSKARLRPRRFLPWGGAVLLAASVAFVILRLDPRQGGDDPWRVKGDLALGVTLTAHHLEDAPSPPEAKPSDAREGEVFVFRATALDDGFVGMILWKTLKDGSTDPTLAATVQKVTAKGDVWLKVSETGETYGYRIDSDVVSFAACAIGGKSEAEAQTALERAFSSRPRDFSGRENCVAFEIMR